ncbi:putative mannitol-1-phosphate/altronate dehydrogenase [Arthrobacter sp. PAMC 25486]|uniref:mannitol dehydrogenase family protein n=1 Tax=Arthrobacter sp. PAMC 25486 TaxID=1494608 RepID=UPI000535C9E7|nr:mannitol dehydrogenase family protein [Arthrobacter sp. PAMC 25486]AIY01125.1 putative mannitol-1-phosphate/altronate dehydrogenase [Arthrobacter sp. PAMC 25486]
MTNTRIPQALNRDTARTAPAAPVRIVHLGLGAFHRAHQAWYTQRASDGNQWGIAAFTGRRPDVALALDAQDGLYTLIERGGEGDTFELMTSIVEAHDGADVAALERLVAAPSTAIVTLTITEAAYNLAADGTLDVSNPLVQADIDILRSLTSQDGKNDGGNAPAAVTAAGRLVQALAARRHVGAGPIAVVSCDNLSNNAIASRAAIGGLADVVDPGLGAWIDANVSYVGTSIDRITPRTTGAEIALVAAECGYRDSSPVVTEPFSDWVLSGEFPAGRPDWSSAGAVFVDEIEHFENRKLWLLNGAHSLMAYAGQLRGHDTVAQALADPVCAGWVEQFWNEAESNLPAEGLNIPAYRAALLERFGNARIAHHLAQIAMDGSNKLRMRAVPVYKAEKAAGRSGAGALRMVAAWVAFLRVANSTGASIVDAAASEIGAALALAHDDDAKALVGILDARLADDEAAMAALVGLLDGFAPST